MFFKDFFTFYVSSHFFFFPLLVQPTSLSVERVHTGQDWWGVSNVLLSLHFLVSQGYHSFCSPDSPPQATSLQAAASGCTYFLRSWEPPSHHIAQYIGINCSIFSFWGWLYLYFIYCSVFPSSFSAFWHLTSSALSVPGSSGRQAVGLCWIFKKTFLYIFICTLKAVVICHSHIEGMGPVWLYFHYRFYVFWGENVGKIHNQVTAIDP